MVVDLSIAGVTASSWTLGVSSQRTPYPMFSWGIGKLQNGASPLWASAMRTVFSWELPGQKPLLFESTEDVIAQITAHGFSAPPLIYEVGDTLREYRPKLQNKPFDEMVGLFAEIEQRWRELIRQL